VALRILLADPDQEWVTSTAGFLKEQMYEVDSVLTGKDAQLAVYNNTYFAVLMNFEIQNHPASQVLKFFKTNYPSLRVVLIFNDKKLFNAGVVNDEKLKKMGAMEILVKPFESSKIRETLEGHQSLGDLMSNLPKKEGVSSEQEVSDDDNNFTKVRIEEFYSSQAVLFDIFIRLSSGRYIKILHAGDTFSKERIDKYKNEKGVDSLYFYNKDRRKYIQFANFLAAKVIPNEKVGAGTKVNMMKSVAQKYAEELFSEGLKPQIIDQGKEVCTSIFNMVEKTDDLYSALRTFQEFDPSAYSHAYAVTLFATAIIKQFEWQSRNTIETTAMACLFHDIGKTKLPKELLGKHIEDMTEQEKEQYKKHPELGVEIMNSNNMVNNSIKQIVLQHHEAFDGTGFPFNLKGNKILTLSNIVCLTDDFVRMMVREKLKPVEALKKILSKQEYVKRYNSTILENFIKVFVDPGKALKEAAALPSNSRMVPSKK